MNSTSTGNFAEQAVSEQLVREGFQVFELNWKTKYAEIDIVAKKDNAMYFIEVKYRANDRFGDGFDYITASKLHHMRRAAEAWVAINNWDGEYALLGASVMGEEGEYVIDIREIA